MNTNIAKVINFDKRQVYINQINERFELFETKSTYVDYTREIKKFFKIEDMSELTYPMLKSIKSEDIIKYLKVYISNNKSENYIKKIRASISKLYSHLIEFSEEYEEEIGYKLFTLNPANTMSVKKTIKQSCNNNHSPKLPVVTRDMINDYIEAVKEHTDKYQPKMKIRNSILIYLMFACGCRRSEAINLQINDLFITDEICYINIKNGKGNKNRTVDIPDKLYDMILEYASTYGLNEDSYIIGNGVYNEQMTKGSVNTIIAKYDKYVSVKINPHGFRHGFALELLNNGALVKSIAYLMGHGDEKTTKVYFSKMIAHKRNIIEI